ncbi:MAG: zinc ribbon domain-containing protein [Desulfotalea sp.]
MSSPELKELEEEKYCPHCKTRLLPCEAPQVHVGDGLGWGANVLFICLNDYCSLFLKGWQHIENKYGHHASYRYMELPGSTESNVMMVGNKEAFTGSVVDPKVIEGQNKRFQAEVKATEALGSAVEENNLAPVLTLLLDEAARKEPREMAIVKLAQLNDIACIDPIRNHTFRDTSFEQKTNMVILRILESNFKKECPECAEIIKAQANKCMHCQADLS